MYIHIKDTNIHTCTLPLQFWRRRLHMYQQVNVNLERWIVYMSAIECHFQKSCIVRTCGKALEKVW